VSTTYAKTAQIQQAAARSPRLRPGVLGLGAALAGVTAVGAAVAIFLAPAAPRALPAMDASLGYAVDARPAVSSLDASQGYWDVVDARPAVSAAGATSLGFWDMIDARPAVRELPAMPTSLGHWDFTAPASAVRPPMPRSMGHWDFTQQSEPTGLGFWDIID
jgi:hypothetical protein